METQEAVKQVEAGAEIADNSPRVIEHMEIGQCVRQGDIYLHRVAHNHPHGKVRKGEEARKLAIGTQAGARHMAEPPAVVYEGTNLPEWCAAGTFLGPCIVSNNPFTVTHPEHADFVLPAGTIQVTHQVDVRTLDRVQD